MKQPPVNVRGQRFVPGQTVIVMPHGQTITDAVITGYDFDHNAYTYTRTSNGANGLILPNLVFPISS